MATGRGGCVCWAKGSVPAAPVAGAGPGSGRPVENCRGPWLLVLVCGVVQSCTRLWTVWADRLEYWNPSPGSQALHSRHVNPACVQLPCPASWHRRRLLPRRRPANTLQQPRNLRWCGRHLQTRCGGECNPSMHSGDCGVLPTFCRSTYGMVSFGDRIWACPMPECVAHATWRRHPPKSTGGDIDVQQAGLLSLLMSALGSGHAVGYGTKGAARRTK